MFIKSQLFHIDQLQPKSLSEFKQLITLLEYTTVYHLNKNLTDMSVHLTGIHCNRVPIEYQRTYTESSFLLTSKAEYEQLSFQIEAFIKELLPQYYVLTKQDPLSELNVEINAINKSTLILSYELY